ncbi:MAG: L,D-transpeptidase, partial [Candidatus Magasanikbacteria bacterium]|nr:L,D-transpeptidase [Candidatus Magasanikbacteria bacterium]
DVKVGQAPVSTGLIGMDTPNGEFKILRKRPVVHYKGPGYDLPNTKWNLEFKKSYYLHGAYWHNQFGIKPMSHGCVNIAYENAEKIYIFLSVGDKVVVTGKTPKGKVQLSALK